MSLLAYIIITIAILFSIFTAIAIAYSFRAPKDEGSDLLVRIIVSAGFSVFFGAVIGVVSYGVDQLIGYGFVVAAALTGVVSLCILDLVFWVKEGLHARWKLSRSPMEKSA